MASNDLTAPLAKFCFRLEADRRTDEGRIRSAAEFRQYFFAYDEAAATDRILTLLPRDVRGPILANWGIRGKKTAMRDDDARVCTALHDAFLAGDMDDQLFEEGIGAELVIQWSALPDWWSFWRGGQHTERSLRIALEAASELGLVDARWFWGTIESADGTLRGTDVVADAMSQAELRAWVKNIHESGDGSPKGLLEALGWPLVVAKTQAAVLLSILDAFAERAGLTPVQSAPSLAPKAEWLADESMEVIVEQALPAEEPLGSAADESPN